jgi:hypothetical protein
MRTLALLMVAACTGGGQSPTDGRPGEDSPPPPPPVDVPLANPGFVTPTNTLKANMEVSQDFWQEIGAADLSCLGTPSADQPTTVAVSLTVTVRDFQSDGAVPGATVSVFPKAQINLPFEGSPFTANDSGTFTMNLPSGTTFFGFDITEADSIRTLLFRESVASTSQATQSVTVASMSNATANTLPALIAVARTPGTGLIVATFRDCQDREVSNFIATVSTVAGVPAHVTGADTYYFSSSVGLPVRHTQKQAASEDGQFMIVNLEPASLAFIQVWGFRDAGELAADQLALIAELSVPVIGDTVIGAQLSPLRQ